jgi:hypothetical protein
MTRSVTTTAARTLQSIREYIAGDSPVLAEGIAADTGAGAAPGFSDLFVSAINRELPDAGDYCFALEYIYEGYLLHYGASRLFNQGSEDFSLLAGDYMYARGLNHVTAQGDLTSIELLSGLINFCSVVHCEKLDVTLAADAWAITTLRIAVTAGGSANGAVSTDLPGQSTDVTVLKNQLASVLTGLLDEFPADIAAGLRDELCNIYDSFNQQRRQHGT